MSLLQSNKKTNTKLPEEMRDGSHSYNINDGIQNNEGSFNVKSENIKKNSQAMKFS